MNEEERSAAALFVDRLGLSESEAESLAADGFRSLEEVAYVPLEELMTVDGFATERAREARERARRKLSTQ